MYNHKQSYVISVLKENEIIECFFGSFSLVSTNTLYDYYNVQF